MSTGFAHQQIATSHYLATTKHEVVATSNIGASRHIQMVLEFNEPGVTDWKVDINGIHSKTKFEYCKSVPQVKKTIFGLMMILVLTAWGANFSAICDVLPTINGVTHKILMQTTEVANYMEY